MGIDAKPEGKGLPARVIGWLAVVLSRRSDIDGCPDPEEIVAWQDGALGRADANRVRMHVANCEACYQRWMSLLEYYEDTQPVVSPAALAEPRARWLPDWLTRPALIAATVVLGIAGLLTLNVQESEESPYAAYQASLQAGAEFRGEIEATDLYRYRDGHLLELVLSPPTRLDGSPAVAVFVEHAGTVSRAPDIEFEMAPGGAVLISAYVGQDISLPAGRSRLLVVLGDAGELPAAEEVASVLSGRARANGRNWTAWAFNVQGME